MRTEVDIKCSTGIITLRGKKRAGILLDTWVEYFSSYLVESCRAEEVLSFFSDAELVCSMKNATYAIVSSTQQNSGSLRPRRFVRARNRLSGQNF